MRETLQPSQRTCHLRFSLVQLAHFLRVQLWLYADRRFSAALREEQDVDGHRAYLQRYLLLYHKLLHTYYHYYYNHHPSKLAQEWAINACIAYTQSTHFQGLFFFLFFTKKATLWCARPITATVWRPSLMPMFSFLCRNQLRLAGHPA